MATTADQAVTITLTGEQRARIYRQTFLMLLRADLPITETSSDPEGARTLIRDAIARLATCVRLLDQVGWSNRTDREDYTLEVDDDIEQLMRHVGRDLLDELGELTGEISTALKSSDSSSDEIEGWIPEIKRALAGIAAVEKVIEAHQTAAAVA